MSEKELKINEVNQTDDLKPQIQDEKAKGYVKTTLYLLLAAVILSIILIAIAGGDGLFGSPTSAEVSKYFSKTILLFISLSIVGVIALVFYILAFVHALKLENKTITILFSVGFVVPVVRVVALFMFLSKLKARDPLPKKKTTFKDFMMKDYTKKSFSVIISILCGLLFGLVIMLIVNPPQAFGGLGAILSAGFLHGGKSFGRVLFNAAPLILTGLSVAFAFKTGLFNIGASGQLMIGSFIAVYIGVKWNLPPTIHWIVAVLGGILGGALWAVIPALLKAFLNVHEVVATIMMNYIAMYTSKMLIQATIYDPVRQESKVVLETARLPKWGLDQLFGYHELNIGIIIAIVTAIIIFLILQKTTFGYQLKAVGSNRHAARYAGINDKRNIILSLVIAGALSGLAGAVIYLVPGTGMRLETKEIISPYGFSGIAVALLGMSHPVGTMFSGLFFGYIEAANLELQSWDFKREIIDIISASIVYFSAFSLYFQMFLEKMFKKKKEKNTKNLDETPPGDDSGTPALEITEGGVEHA